MSLQESPRERPEANRIPHFIHSKTGYGPKEAWHAHIAGPCRWFACHPGKRTKPCLHEVTGGQLLCSFCSHALPVETIGYQPLFRELDSRPCFVVLHETVREVVDALRFHSRVLVGRGEDQADGVYVIPALTQQPHFVTAVPWKRVPVNLVPSLLKVWGLPDLAAWYHETERSAGAGSKKSETSVEVVPVEPSADGVPATERVAPNWRGAYREFLDQVGTGGIPRPVGMNGKHTKPPT